MTEENVMRISCVNSHTQIPCTLYNTASLLINTFRKKCNPQQINSHGNTALMLAIQRKINYQVILSLVNTFCKRV
jgi:hypothetical protein